MRMLTLGFAFLLIVAACDSQDLMAKFRGVERDRAVPRTEITAVDIFAIDSIRGDQVEVFGVGIGDSKERVLARLGEPDRIMEFPDIAAVNFEYSKKLNMTNPGLVVQIRNGTVHKITFKQPFNRYLHGDTVIAHTKDEVYFHILGVPDSQEEIHLFRVFYYEDEGFEAIIRKGLLNGFSLVAPHPVQNPKRKVDPALLALAQADTEQ